MKHLLFSVVLAIVGFSTFGCGDDVIVQPCTAPFALVTFESDTPDAFVVIQRLDHPEPFEPGKDLPYTERLKPGYYEFSFGASGYEWYTMRRTLSAGDIETIHIELAPQ